MVKRFDMRGNYWPSEDGHLVSYSDYQKLEAENQKLREQRDAANAHIQFLNRVIAGDAE